MKLLGQTGLTKLITLIKSLNNDYIIPVYNHDKSLLKFNSNNETIQINLNKVKHSVGDIKYTVSKTPTIGRWLLLNGRQITKEEFPTLCEFLSDDYKVDDNTYTLPNLLDNSGTLIEQCSDNIALRVSGNSGENLTRSNLPNVDIKTISSDTYKNYKGNHQHRFKFKSTNKSGTDTMTVMSYSENRGTYIKSTETGYDNYKGEHTHQIHLNTGTQEPMQTMQRTACIGNWYIYAGDED